MWTRFTRGRCVAIHLAEWVNAGNQFRGACCAGESAQASRNLIVVRFRFFIGLLAAVALVHVRAAEPPPEAFVVVIGDGHSAYDKVAQFVAHLDRLKAEYPHVP